MNQALKLKIFTLLQREVQEYRNSFLFTPAAISALLILLMLTSAIFANRIAVVGNSVMEVLVDEHSRSGMNITISIDDDVEGQDFIITEETLPDGASDDSWNFSKGWTFNPERASRPRVETGGDGAHIESLNPVLNVLHALFLVIMFFISINYLLGTLHSDRRDRSVLFWKSMPVSEWQEVCIKMATVSLIIPGIYVALSILTQLAYVLLAMLLVWRMDSSPTEVILDNLDFVSLFAGQLGGWMIWVLWSAPFYAWLLFSSAAAKRSPLMFAIAIPLGVVFITEVFLDTEAVSNAFSNHVPHLVDDGSGGQGLGFYLYGPEWLSLDYLGMVLGLGVAAALMAGAVWFRKHRFEL